MSKKILWVGDAGVASGFAMATHAVCDYLHEQGWEVHVLGVNYYGDPHEYPYTLYPAFNPLSNGRDQFGIGRLPYLIHSIEPDVVVIMTDPWHIPNYLDSIKHTMEEGYPLPPVVGWLAVDGQNQKGDALNELAHVVTWTKFAANELIAGGYTGETDVVPLGVDLSRYTPRDKAESRRTILGPDTLSRVGDNAFILGAVGRNQPRKRLDLTLSYFSDWIHAHGVDNAYLYLHVGPTGDAGVDLKSLCKFYNLKGRVIINTPNIGQGMNPKLMPFVYSMLDAYVTTSQGEGWGLPALEAMACGVPCVLPRWAALSEWPVDGALLIPCYETAVTAPINGMMYTIGGIPDRDQFIDALQDLYRSEIHRKAHSTKGLRVASKFPWSATASGMATVLDKVLYNRPQTDTSAVSSRPSPQAEWGRPGEPIPADDAQHQRG